MVSNKRSQRSNNIVHDLIRDPVKCLWLKTQINRGEKGLLLVGGKKIVSSVCRPALLNVRCTLTLSQVRLARSSGFVRCNGKSRAHWTMGSKRLSVSDARSQKMEDDLLVCESRYQIGKVIRGNLQQSHTS